MVHARRAVPRSHFRHDPTEQGDSFVGGDIIDQDVDDDDDDDDDPMRGRGGIISVRQPSRFMWMSSIPGMV